MCGCFVSNFVHLNIGRTKSSFFRLFVMSLEFLMYVSYEIGPTEVNSNL